MAKKKHVGNKVPRLTEEDYEKYIMALKDETPPEIVRKTQAKEKVKHWLKKENSLINGEFSFFLLPFTFFFSIMWLFYSKD